MVREGRVGQRIEDAGQHGIGRLPAKAINDRVTVRSW
jgi:hypothetical protein